MMQFLNSIWEWILINKDNIMTFLTSTDFVATITTFVALFKSMKTTRNNTLSIDSIKGTMKENHVIKEDVETVRNTVTNILDNVNSTINSVKESMERVSNVEAAVKMFAEESTAKLNAMLEVQSIVYSTIKDDAIRNSVNSILISAKHSDNASKIKLQEELDAIRAELKAKNDELDATVTKMMDKVATEVTAVPAVETVNTASNNITRY